MNNEIARTLANRYATIYYVDLSTNHYVEYSASDDYKELEVPAEGADFFSETYGNVQRVIHPEDLWQVEKVADKDFMISVTENGRKFRMEYRLLMSGKAHHMRLMAVRTDDQNHLIIALENIDDEMRGREELKAISEKNLVFSQIAESLAAQYGMIYYIDTETDAYIEFTATQAYKEFNINPSGSDFFGTSQRNVSTMIHPADRERVFDALDKQTMLEAMNQNGSFTMTYRLLLGNGSSYTRMSVFWANDHKHLIMAVMNIEQEIRREQELAQKLSIVHEKAYRDDLTGVKNKTAFVEYEEDMQSQIHLGKAEAFSIVVCDVNGLKRINDTYGHQAGDEHIVKACRMICDIFQHSAVFRTGGDEFVVLLTGRDYMIRKELVLALHDRSVEHISTDGVVISGGLADYRVGEDKSFHEVFERADAMMYTEKQLLKGMGAATRDDEEAAKPAFGMDENADILRIKRQILIVEDERINQMLLGNMLEGGFELLYASDGIEALEQIRTHKDNLAMVLLDLQMPRMSGIEVLKIMKAEKEFQDIPVIVMTADQSAEVECLRIGAIDFIPKPYPTVEIIQARVNRCIELSEKRTIIQSTERDSLTNLFNLDYFLRYVRMYDRHYTEMPMDAIVLDINHFHVLNERYGKQYGDSVLARIGNRIRQISREVGGVGCRRGADVFLIYCPHREDYEALLDKVSEGLAGEDVSESRVRLRMGVYSNVDKSLEIERRFDYARTAANTVRTGFLKGIGIYDTKMHEAELYKARLLEDFKPSLENRRFTVFFQPKFDIRPDTPLLASAEALVRWNHPELGMISPAVFIPLLEDNGLILELDRFVWRETAARIRDWKDGIGYSVPVSVNVSRIDMLTPNLKSIFREILDEFRLSARDFALEITESAYTGDSDQVISTAKELRGMDFRIEMDDFGTGYSSLGLLSQLPIDVLKLDMSFLRSAFGKTRDTRMIELIIDIADYLHVPVIAEGVETEEQYLVLKTMGCDMVQGYYFSKPVPADDFVPFLIARSKAQVAVPPAVKKTCMSISMALNSHFENIYHVDLVTDHYLEFYSDQDGQLRIRPGGTDFFGEVLEKLLKDVCEEDSECVRAALGKAGLIRLAGQNETVSLPLHKLKDGRCVPYTLQTIQTRESDTHHVVIGVKPE